MSEITKYNIALLGKSGVGKSTIVNSFANYITYDTFKDALRGDPICIIPTRYYMESESGKPYYIQLGNPDKNESQEDGHSCTQSPKVYEFTVGNEEYNFIDVPGIGDTRGTDMDAENRTKILGVLSTFTEIHGILILLAAQDNKLSAEYQYCLTEILTMIHRDALENVFFVFTNSVGHGFRGSESLNLLKKYLKDMKKRTTMEINITPDNTFFIDNEGFRIHGFYNQHQNAVAKNDLRRCKKSWDHTRNEMYRLFDCVKKVKPHEVQNSISLNEARTIGVLLLEPLAAMTTLIAHNTDNVDSMAKNVNDAFQIHDIQINQLDKPRTVCTSKTCIAVSPIAGNKSFTATYKQVCHSPCYLRGVQLKTMPEPRLLDCAAMGGGDSCSQCARQGHNCSYKMHMHIDFEQRIVVRETILTRAITNAKASANPKAEMKKIMKQLEKELEIILDCVVRFMTFLKEHAFSEHNEFFEKRLDVEIRNQEVIAQQDGQNGQAVVDRLKAIKDNHTKQMKSLKLISSTIAHGKSISAAEILESRDRLFNLKYNGPKIKEIYTTTNGKVLENAKKKATTEVTF